MEKSAARVFRADINGLRAWAVLAVILFHFKVGGFDGGYVGVDIFFVISGFLMTGIIARALQKNNAAAQPVSFLWNFFLARGKRILPALIVLCLFLLVFGWFALSVDEYKTLGEQTRSAVLFFSNIKFWRETSYFAASAHSQWLLHTWSLSVEWQFYMLLPFGMLLVWKIWPSQKALLVAMTIVGALSLGLCLVVAADKPSTAFFMLPFRAWEMVAGGLVALAVSRPPASALARNALELGGLALITYSIVGFGHLVWPDWHALVPVAGTVMVLLAAKQSSVLTDWAPLRWAGERSYSMYLWHWPLVVALYYFGDSSDPAVVAACIALTCLLGHLSYELVETRMRRPLETMPRGAGSLALVAACAAVVLPGIVITGMNGFPARLPDNVAQMFDSAKDKGNFSPDCNIVENGNDAACVSKGSRLGLVVLGDSHGEALFDAAKAALPQKDLQAARWTLAGCPTMKGTHNVNEPSLKCEQFVDWAVKHVETVPASVPVLIINRTSIYFEGKNEVVLDDDRTVPNVYFDKRYATRSPEFYREVRQQLIDTACTIARHHRVYMLRPVPEMRVNVPSVLGHAMMIGKERHVSLSMDEYRKRHAMAWEAQNAARDQCGVTLLDPRPYLCTSRRCEAVAGNQAFYYDNNHLSQFGASRLTPLFSTIFEQSMSATKQDSNDL